MKSKISETSKPSNTQVALKEAIDNDNLRGLQEIVNSPEFRINNPIFDGHTVFEYAMAKNNLELGKLFLVHPKFDPNTNHVPHWLVINHEISLLEKFLDEPDFQVHGLDQEGRTALHWAAVYGDLKTVKILLDKKSTTPEHINLKDKNNQTPLDLANLKEYEEVAAYLKLKLNQLESLPSKSQQYSLDLFSKTSIKSQNKIVKKALDMARKEQHKVKIKPRL